MYSDRQTLPLQLTIWQVGLVYEAPIDLLSFICLYPQDWQTRSYLALGGVSGKALDRFLSERKDIRKVFLCLDSDAAGNEACTRLAQSIPGEIAVIRLVPARKDWNDVLRQQGDIPSRKFIAETITLRELPTAQPVPMLRMADVELTSVEWLWFPYIPFGKLTIIQGNPGEGKTYFAMRLAAACTNRKPLPGMETLEPFNIIYQTAEDGLGDTVKPRLIEADADLERVLVIDDRDTPLTLADERIARAIRENSARLVIIDPVQAFLGADVDMNRANEVRPIFRSLGDIAQATGCAIVLIGHLNKAAGTQSTYRGLGSIDITAAVRSLLFIGKLKDSPTTRVLIHEKSSLAPPGQSIAFSLGDEKGFAWIGAYDITADELLAGTDTAKTESKTAQAQMLILEPVSYTHLIVDLHCFEYTGEGEILYEGDCFPIETFSGKGKIEEIEVSCIEPYSQVMFHLGYEFDENDVHDVKLLCETFHIEIPNEYR